MIEIVSDDAIAGLAELIDIDAAVRRALIEVALGEVTAAPVLRAAGARDGEAINLKFAASAKVGLVGGKIGTWWPGNASRGLANHAATTLLLDPETGFPMALVAARLLNRLRTAAADAAAVDMLARRDARVLAVIGAGGQAPFEARAIARVRELREIRIGARSGDAAVKVAASLADLGTVIRVCDVEAAVRGADIIVCATAARSAVVRSGWVGPGVHISAMGADAAGKQELDIDLVVRGRLFADMPRQSVEIGEFQRVCRSGRIDQASVSPLGLVLNGHAPGRRTRDELTIFDSSGLAVQDLFAAAAAPGAARAAGGVQTVAF